MPLENASTLILIGFIAIIVSLFFLILGINSVKKRKLKQHRNFMGVAASSNLLFLVVYIFRLIQEGNTKFIGPKYVFNYIYLPILVVHIGFAIISAYFVSRQIWMGIVHVNYKNDGTPTFSGEYRLEHINRGRIGAKVWGISFFGGIIIFFLLYIIF